MLCLVPVADSCAPTQLDMHGIYHPVSSAGTNAVINTPLPPRAREHECCTPRTCAFYIHHERRLVGGPRWTRVWSLAPGFEPRPVSRSISSLHALFMPSNQCRKRSPLPPSPQREKATKLRNRESPFRMCPFEVSWFFHNCQCALSSGCPLLSVEVLCGFECQRNRPTHPTTL